MDAFWATDDDDVNLQHTPSYTKVLSLILAAAISQDCKGVYRRYRLAFSAFIVSFVEPVRVVVLHILSLFLFI